MDYEWTMQCLYMRVCLQVTIRQILTVVRVFQRRGVSAVEFLILQKVAAFSTASNTGFMACCISQKDS